ncbi:hypothetical protein C4J86_0810 [Pseudomonas sp. R2-7-07]|nr:hypothetical protein C4J86_0810 [Pseudomonas sp. R2-7-07]
MKSQSRLEMPRQMSCYHQNTEQVLIPQKKHRKASSLLQN